MHDAAVTNGGPGLRGRVCLLRQGNYPDDPRVHREAMALVDAGFTVDLIGIRDPGEKLVETVEGVRVIRVPLSRKRAGKLRYVFQYAAFFLAASLLVTLLHLRHRYRLIQVHTVPDTLVFAAAIPKLLGARVVLDLHEMFPEFFGTKFGERPTVHRVLVAAEQAAIRFADAAFTCTSDMRETFVARGADPAKMGVVLNAAEEEVFDVAKYPPVGSPDGEFVLIVHGTVEQHYGHDTAIRAVALLGDEIPGLRLEIVGDGSYLQPARELARELGVEDRVRFAGRWVPMPDLLTAIQHADAGVVAMKRDPFRDLTHCNKMYDLVTMRRPVLNSRTRSVQSYFGEECFEYFDSDDHVDLAEAIRRVHASPQRREEMVAKAAAALEPYRWPRQRAVYLGIVDAALHGRPVAPAAKVAAEAVAAET